ncbi:hypothetical protein BU14_0493s0005 [Porphyra umbilicalis]|uniref:Phosphatidic acid phosphatase type 2/haloperoxidase domain-containing protein n=1 Tax=Porphyra umbilicalis TaxID=2786 RepID=A0A1X6NTN3_PORUM|nr:hypothetical protein BU14_0493s0005 [Porphyra umbilicalis]|eukprot:OSX71860.1 hypothetical protein BU14_0493s0005 [Porphyra umbilicalis]
MDSPHPRRFLGRWLLTAVCRSGLPSTAATLIASGVAAAVARGREPPVRPFYPADSSLWRLPGEGVPYTQLVLVGVLAATPVAAAAAAATAAARGRRGTAPLLFAALRVGLATLAATAAAAGVVEVIKTHTGALRPDFAARCLGDAAVPALAAGTSGAPAQIVVDGGCPAVAAAAGAAARDAAVARLKDGRRSFPSGHAALAGAFSAAAAVALGGLAAAAVAAGAGAAPDGRRRYGRDGGGSLGWAAVGEAAAVAAAAALLYGAAMLGSRVADGRHHAGDVAAGGLLGALFAVAGVVPALVAVAGGGGGGGGGGAPPGGRPPRGSCWRTTMGWLWARLAGQLGKWRRRRRTSG